MKNRKSRFPCTAGSFPAVFFSVSGGTGKQGAGAGKQGTRAGAQGRMINDTGLIPDMNDNGLIPDRD